MELVKRLIAKFYGSVASVAETPYMDEWTSGWSTVTETIVTGIQAHYLVIIIALLLVFIFAKEWIRKRGEGRPSYAIQNNISTRVVTDGYADQSWKDGQGQRTWTASGGVETQVANTAILGDHGRFPVRDKPRADYDDEAQSSKMRAVTVLNNTVMLPNEFRSGENIRNWLRKFEHYAVSVKAEDRFSLLLTVIGDDNERLISGHIDDGPDERKYERAKEMLLNLHDKPILSEFESQSMFLERCQVEGENRYVFAADLEVLAKEASPTLQTDARELKS